MKYKSQGKQLSIDDFRTSLAQLAKSNRWVMLGDNLPWEDIEKLSQVSEQISRARKVLVCYLCNWKYNKFHTNLFYAHENKNRKKVQESNLQTTIRFDSSINSQEIYQRL